MASTAKNDPATRDAFVNQVFNDPEFIREVQSSDNRLKNGEVDVNRYHRERKFIAAKWSITLSELGEYQVSRLLPVIHKTSRATLRADFKNQKFSIEFSPLATRAELLEEWDKFIALRSTNTEWKFAANGKRKPMLQPDLVLAILKQRRAGKTFPQIFELYSSGELPEYSGNPNQFPHAIALARYYNRFKDRM